jgi:hypothetical protein
MFVARCSKATGAPAQAIQDLAAHQDLITRQREVHLSPAAIDNAIRLLDSFGILLGCGDMLETGNGESAISNS